MDKILKFNSAKYFLSLIGAFLMVNTVAWSQDKITLDQLRDVRIVNSPVISPDGEWIIYTISDRNSEVNTLRLLNVNSGNESFLIQGDDSYSSPKWSPSGNHIAFLSNSGQDNRRNNQIWMVDISGENLKQVSNHTSSIMDFKWGPNEDNFLFRTREGNHSNSVAVEHGVMEAGEFLYLLEIQNGSTAKINNEPQAGIEYDWSPDSNQVVVSYQEEAGFYGRFESDLFIIQLDNDNIKPIVNRPGMDRLPTWSPDGRYIAFLSNYGLKGGLLPNIGLAVYDTRTDQILDYGQELDAGGFFEGPTRINWDQSSNRAFYNISYKAHEHIFYVDVAAENVRQFTNGNRSHSGMSVASNANRIAFMVTEYNSPYEIYVSALDNLELNQLTNTEQPFDFSDFPSASVIEWNSSDGTNINGLLVTPPDYDPNKTYPLMVYLHGGPASAVGNSYPTFSFFNPMRDDLFAANDYLVLIPNFRGSGGFGYDFRAALTEHWGQKPYEDVITGVDYVSTIASVDRERIGLMGWSYGGYLAAYTITQTNQFKTAVIGAGVTDLGSHYGQLSLQMIEYMGGNPWEESYTQKYLDSSPLYLAGNIQTPVLFIHGENDTAVSITQAEQLHAALLQLGVPAKFLRYPNQGHSFFGEEVQEDSFKQVLDWANTYMK